MCGISGILAFTARGEQLLPGIADSVGVIRQRGPDNQGSLIKGKVALGHARLSVIDLSPDANQPFASANGRYHIVFNGEIYNYQELRDDLVSKGFVFRTQSDTEVLLNLYIAKGPSMLNQLKGFFSFGIYDEIEETLFLARDRFGVKPLIYTINDDRFIFSSRLSAITCIDKNYELDPDSVFHYFELNYIPPNYSIFRNCRHFPAGHYGIVEHETIHIHQYYKPENQTLSPRKPLENTSTDLRYLLEAAVERRLVSDVPLGAFLSGGIDSSIITALAAGKIPGLNTFTVGFSDAPHFDERKYAAELAKKYNTRHHEIMVETADLLTLVPEVLDQLDEPFADSSALAVYLLSREVKKHVSVALSGDGADEIFGGYIKYSAFSLQQKATYIRPALWMLWPMLKKLPQSRNNALTNLARQLNRLAEGWMLPEDERYWRWCSISNHAETAALLQLKYDRAEIAMRQKDMIRQHDTLDPVNAVLKNDQFLVLQGDMLRKVDSMSMAHALEVRLPFLDHAVVEFLNSLPSKVKVNGRQRKILLRDAFGHLLPKSILNKPKKGFEVPLLTWFNGALSSMIHDTYLNDSFIREQGVFQPLQIQMLLKKLKSSNPGDAASRIWALIVFQAWWIKYHQLLTTSSTPESNPKV